MIAWKEWSREAFVQARDLGAPVLLLLPAGRTQPELEAAFSGLDSVVERFVTLCADRCDRPDVHRRYADGEAALCLLSHDGRLLARCGLGEVKARLPEWIESYAPSDAPKAAEGPAWTGAVGARARPQPAVGAFEAALDAALAAAEPAGFHELELLLYAAADRGEPRARARLDKEAESLAARLAGRGARTLGGYASASRLLWEAFSLTGSPRLREAALELSSRMIRELYDAERRCFRHTGSPASDVFADENAQAALALQRAAAFEPAFRFAKTADDILAFLQSSAYDPLLGMIHRRHEAGSMVYGLLGDNAWTILAFTEAFQVTGHKPHREFADGLARFLFQELWDRDNGGFLDRVPQGDDVGLLGEPRRARPEDHATALESLWRLHHLKGNMNYKRWLDWALAAVADEAPRAPGLARVQDIQRRGRLDLELVGRPGEQRCDELLAALHRHYAPRRIVSFVDPDDQDYILAHRLEVEGPSTLFGCVDLRPVASAASASGVPAVLKALS